MKTATQLHEIVSDPSPTVTLPTIDEEAPIATQTGSSRVKLVMQQILHHLRQGRNLGPITVLLLVLIYSLLSPHLPAPIHDYIYHIAH